MRNHPPTLNPTALVSVSCVAAIAALTASVVAAVGAVVPPLLYQMAFCAMVPGENAIVPLIVAPGSQISCVPLGQLVTRVTPTSAVHASAAQMILPRYAIAARAATRVVQVAPRDGASVIAPPSKIQRPAAPRVWAITRKPSGTTTEPGVQREHAPNPA